MDLLHPQFLHDVAAVLAYGAKKYGAGNWKALKHGRERYLGALFRHLIAYSLGERLDAETGLPHLAHAGCCLMFMAGFDAEGIPELPVPCGDAECQHCFPGVVDSKSIAEAALKKFMDLGKSDDTCSYTLADEKLTRARLADDVADLFAEYERRGVVINFSVSDFITDLAVILVNRG